MTKSILIFLSLCSCLLAEPVLRISKVVAENGEGVEQVAYAYVDGDGVECEDMIFVQKAAIVTEADVKTAHEGFVEKGSINVVLTEEGGAKMGEATANMQLHIDRMAIIVEGKVMSAPVVQAKLGRNFIITGLEDFSDKQKAELIARLNGKPVPKE